MYVQQSDPDHSVTGLRWFRRSPEAPSLKIELYMDMVDLGFNPSNMPPLVSLDA